MFTIFSTAEGVLHNGLLTEIAFREVGSLSLQCAFQESRKFHVILMAGFYY